MEEDDYHVPLEHSTSKGGQFKWDPESIDSFMTKHSASALEEMGGIQGVAGLLKTNLKKGLSESKNFVERTEFYGVNYLPPPPAASWFALFFEAWKDEAVIILSVSAVVALVAGGVEQYLGLEQNGWIDGVAILVACLIVATVTSTNDYIKDLQFRKLKEDTNSKKTVRVIRGEEKVIPLQDLTVGDVVRLHSGDKIPADGLLIPGLDEILVNESDLTGEPDDLIKDHRDPFLLSGCPVKKGSGTFLVTAVGPNTMWGRTLNNIAEEEDTPLQVKLNDLVEKIGYVGMGVAVIVFLVLLGWYIKDFVISPTQVVNCTDNPSEVDKNNSMYPCNLTQTGDAQLVPNEPYQIRVPSKWRAATLVEVLGSFIVAVTIVVVAVPEGLPLAVTISLAYSMQQMLDDKNFVRHLAACEIMGGATNICSDKTGTLTENRMRVIEGWTAGTFWEDVDDLDTFLTRGAPELSKLFMNSLCLNVEDGKLEKKTTNGKEVVNFIGSSTECAFLVLAETLGGDPETLQAQHTPVKFYQFNSDRKRMSRAFPLDPNKETIRLYVKGAAEIVKGLCTSVIKPDGSRVNLSKKKSQKLDELISGLQAKGLRTLCIAYRDFDGPQEWTADGQGFEEELCLISIMGIEDPLREEVPAAVATCLGAGITVRMVTGDNLLTAKKIATDCGILTPGGLAMEGKEFREMTEEDREDMLRNKNLQVLARAIPNDKLVLVKSLKAIGEVVAVTGDGTNDGPALKEADVGLAMGISGTEVAREMADIIILDDNFASIVLAVKWGRCVYDNIRKFLQFQLTVNVVALLVAFIGAVSSYGTPLTAVQLLWVNLIMDTMAALALGTERPQDRLLWRKPYGREGKLITATMWRNIIGQAIFQVAVLCTILYATDPQTGRHLIWDQLESGKYFDGPNLHYTFLFNTFVFLQVFNEINSRKVNSEFNVFAGLFTNWIFVGIIIFTIAAQMLIVELGGVALNTVSLFKTSAWSPYFWGWSILLGAMSLPIGMLLRFIPVPLETWEVEEKPREVIEFEEARRRKKEMRERRDMDLV